MENEKRKKKNKKKNKQRAKAASTTDDNTSNAGETSSGEQNHVVHNQLNHRSLQSNDDAENHTSDKIVHDKNGGRNAEIANGSSSAQIGKENWFQEEVKLREMVKQLLYEKNSYMQKQADLEMKIKQLQCDNDSWHEKKVGMEQRIGKLLQERASLCLEERNWREKVNHLEEERASLAEKENSSKEMIATLSEENRRLQVQVVELEGAKINISQENMHLLDKISTLLSQIKYLEGSLATAHSSTDAKKDVPENDDLNAQIEEAFTLIEKLMAENADLVEKLNELYVELSSRRVAAEVTSVGIPDYVAGRDPVGSSGNISSSAKGVKLFESITIEDERVASDVDQDYANVRHSSETAVSGEIVQIPLDENEVQDVEAQASPDEADETVPLTDAPIIGAPFRLVSFVARYVSGADLVDQRPSESS